MGMRSKLILVLVLVFALSTVASASIITGVDRSYGRSANKPPIGVYDGNTDPLPMDPGGIADGLVIYSDRTYPFINTPAGMLGNEWVRTFNDDKNSGEYDVSYLVTIGEDSPLWIAVDDRLTGSSEFGTQLEWIELATYRFPCGIEWADTGMDLYVKENDTTFRPMSVWTTTTALAAGSYDFGLNPSGNNFYIIGAVPEPMTIALLGLGGLGLIRRKRN
jgi:hypothetical protein